MSATTTDAELRPGELVLDRFRLRRPLGRGGSGVVWSAHDEQLGRDVAVKRLRPDAAADALAEARLSARLGHPAIVAVYGVGSGGTDGGAWVIAELVEGCTLRHAIREDTHTDGELLQVGLALCAALRHAHRRGLVHRDVTPRNVLLPVAAFPDRTGRASGEVPPAKLTDFGIAHLIEGAASADAGSAVGTLGYMAPERFRGEAGGPAADVYALGVVLHEALTGAHPAGDHERAGEMARAAAALPALGPVRPDLPSALTAAITRAHHPEPAQRGTPAELADALQVGARALGLEVDRRRCGLPPDLAEADPTGEISVHDARPRRLRALARAVTGPASAGVVAPDRGGPTARSAPSAADPSTADPPSPPDAAPARPPVPAVRRPRTAGAVALGASTSAAPPEAARTPAARGASTTSEVAGSTSAPSRAARGTGPVTPAAVRVGQGPPPAGDGDAAVGRALLAGARAVGSAVTGLLARRRSGLDAPPDARGLTGAPGRRAPRWPVPSERVRRPQVTFTTGAVPAPRPASVRPPRPGAGAGILAALLAAAAVASLTPLPGAWLLAGLAVLAAAIVPGRPAALAALAGLALGATGLAPLWAAGACAALAARGPAGLRALLAALPAAAAGVALHVLARAQEARVQDAGAAVELAVRALPAVAVGAAVVGLLVVLGRAVVALRAPGAALVAALAWAAVAVAVPALVVLAGVVSGPGPAATAPWAAAVGVLALLVGRGAARRAGRPGVGRASAGRRTPARRRGPAARARGPRTA